ncbi:hypothetical protein [Legionella qingyii]|uniref:hypothetical protein n=1 Tax=Legionella qingyii TaxID=2184757 RepID=UPI001315A63F|nr:hypothetical protein [Legionella qingyii]
MRKKIDQLLAYGQEDEAVFLIEKLWERETKAAQAEQRKLINQLNRRINELENRLN